MLKKIDKNVISEIHNNLCFIQYSPSFNLIEWDSNKIENAILKLRISSKSESGSVIIRNINGEIIEFIEELHQVGDYIVIDISDELQNMLSEKRNELILGIVLLRDNFILFDDPMCEAVIEYTPYKVAPAESAYQETDVKKAGAGKLNLFTGKMKFFHEDVAEDGDVLPISVGHVYNSLDANLENDRVETGNKFITLPKYRCGKGWKLNVQQYLTEEKFSWLEGEETAKKFTYVDAEGNHQIFEEKYYYINDSKQKVYLLPENIDIDAEQNLSYTVQKTVNGTVTEVKYNVERETKSTTGLKLISAPEDFKGIKYIDKDIEEITNLKNDINQVENALKEIDISLKYNAKNICFMLLSKNVSAVQNDIQKLTFNNNKVTDDSTVEEKDIKIKNKELFEEYIYSELGDNALKKIVQQIVRCGAFELSEKEIENFVEYLDESSRKKYFTNGNTKSEIGNWNQSKTGVMQYDLEIERAVNQIKTLNNNKNEYDIYLEKAERRLTALEKQVPVHYITDSDGVMMGFGVTETKDLYRLVLIADKWENAIFIRYDNEDRIENIIDANESVISFEYDKKTGYLAKIKDGASRITAYTYDANGFLLKITYPDKNASTYTYDNAGFLISAVEPSGYGVKYDYLNQQVTRITEITRNERITGDSVNMITFGNMQIGQENYSANDVLNVEYYDYKSTTVTDKYQKRLTYIFDNAGRTVTVYENKFEEEAFRNNAAAVSFGYQNNKNAFTISARPQSLEFLDGGNFIKNDNWHFYEYSTDNVEENYLGGGLVCDEIICGDAPMPAAYSVETADNEYGNIYVLPSFDENDFSDPIRMLSREITPEMLEAINLGGKKDFVLSGWAKADSLPVNRRNTDYCGMCDTDKFESGIYEELASEHQRQRRFELRAELTYRNGNNTRVEKQYASFDWMQTEWQYCALPVAISENPADKLIGIKVIFDYSYNWGQAEFYGMSLKEGKWEYSEYNEDDLKIYSENSESEYIAVYEYDEDNNPVKTALMDRENFALKSSGKEYKEYATVYEYNYASAPVRSIDYNGIVTEYEYNEKGVAVKTVTYHKDAPSSKLYRESLLDDYGKETGGVNELGAKICDYEYVKGTGNISVATETNGAKTSYGYGADGNTLLSISSDVDGEVNANICGYTLGLLTKQTHNGTDIDYEYDGFGRLTKIDIAGENYLSALHEQTYGNFFVESGGFENIISGEKVTTTFATGEIFESVSDNKGNLLKVNYNGSPLIENVYDMYGTLEEIKDYANGTAAGCAFGYDEKGNVTKRGYTGYGADLRVENEYGENGTQTKTRFIKSGGNARVTRFLHDDTPEARLRGITLASGAEQSLAYDKLGRVNGVAISKNKAGVDIKLSKDIHYLQRGDHASNLVASEWFGKNGVNKDNLKYAYDEKGNITAIRENGELITRYAYDGLSRLIREDNKKLDKTCVFAYDCGGNILYRKEYRFTLAKTDALAGGNTFTYEYPSEGWKDRIISYNGAQIGNYDALGNPRLYRGKNLSWSHGRHLDSIGNINYTYNANGIRLSKTVNGKTTKFYADGTTILAQECEGNVIYFDYAADGIAGFTYNGKEYYYKKNVQGDILAVIDASGAEITRYVYDAWGNHKVLVLDGTQYIDTSINQTYAETGLNNKVISEMNPFRYRGYYYDTETGLYYLNSRYYDSEVGRFINADDISYAEPDTLNGLNLFAYCVNNPVMYVDPLGQIALFTFFITLLIGFGVGAAVGGGVEVVKQIQSNKWNPSEWNWRQIGISALGGGIAGLISSIPIGGRIGAFVFGGIGAIAGGLITGTVNGWESALFAFGIGSFANLVSFGISCKINSIKASKIFNQNSKAKSLAIQKLQGHRLNMGKKALKGNMRNAFKNTSLSQIKILLNNSSPWLRYSIYSTIFSSLLSATPVRGLE